MVKIRVFVLLAPHQLAFPIVRPETDAYVGLEQPELKVDYFGLGYSPVLVGNGERRLVFVWVGRDVDDVRVLELDSRFGDEYRLGYDVEH